MSGVCGFVGGKVPGIRTELVHFPRGTAGGLPLGVAAVDLLLPADVTGRCAGGGSAEEELEAGEAVGTGGETEADAGAG